MLKINWSKLKGDKGTILSLVDLLMILLVIVNLTYIVVEWSFTINFVNDFLKEFVPPFHGWYDTHLHRNFYWYDMYFVAIFITEFCIRWFMQSTTTIITSGFSIHLFIGTMCLDVYQLVRSVFYGSSDLEAWYFACIKWA